jgi:hypothetical protein
VTRRGLVVGTAAMLALFSCFRLKSCGTEVGRLAFAAPGMSSSTLPLKAGDVSFWTDLDVHYEGAPPLVYQVDLAQGGRNVASAFCDPLGRKDIDTGWLSLYDGPSHTERGRGKMHCTVKLAAAGPTTIQATLLVDPPSSAVTLTKADLVIRQ